MVAPFLPMLKKSREGRVELRQVEVLRLDERREVEQVVAEDVEPLDADRTDDVRRVAGSDLDLELVGGDAVVVDLDGQVDRLLASVEVRRELLLGGDLFRLSAAAEADEPADDLAAVGAGALGDRRGGDGERRGARRCGGGGDAEAGAADAADVAATLGAAALVAALGAVVAAEPLQADAMIATTPRASMTARGRTV